MPLDLDMTSLPKLSTVSMGSK